MRVWEWLLFILSVLILILYVYIQSSSPSQERYLTLHRQKLVWVELDQVLSTANNGDLIFLAGNTKGEKTCRWFANSIFSHVGLLFRERHPKTQKDILYIFDCDLGQSMKDGVRVMPLEDKLHRYKGFKVGAIKKLWTRSSYKLPQSRTIVDLIPKYLNKGFDSRFLSWVLADFPLGYYLAKNSNTMFCSELVSACLQDLGILEKDRVSSWYNPGDYYRGKLKLSSGFFYGEPKFFEF